MSSGKERYVEFRGGGSDPVGSFSARRIPQELRDWIADESSRTGRKQRYIIEDIFDTFIKHRKSHNDCFHYECLPRNNGKTFRMFIHIDLVNESLRIIERDKIFNGDFVNAAIKHYRHVVEKHRL